MEYEYAPAEFVITVTTLLLQLKTRTIGSAIPTPVRVPDTVNEPPGEGLEDVAIAVNDVETGFVRVGGVSVFRFRVMSPLPDTVTTVGSFMFTHDNPSEHDQLAKVYPDGT